MADGGGCCEDSPPDAAQHEEEDVPKTRLQPGCRARVSKADEEASVEEGLVGQEVAVEGWPSVLAGGSPRWPVRLVVSDRRLNIPATSLHAEQRDMFARLGDSAEADDLLSLLLEGCDLDAMVQIKAASRRLRALTRQVIGGRAWRSHPEHLHQMRCALWRGARYQYFSSAPHTDAVSALVIDGPLFATGSWDRTVKVWSSELGQSAYSLPHAEAVVGVALRNGRLASSGCDGKLRVWCPRLGSIELPNSAINSTGPLAWATSSQLLVGGAAGDFKLRMWDVDTACCTVAEGTHVRSVVSLVADASLGVSGSWDSTVKLWSIDERLTCKATLQPKQGGELVGQAAVRAVAMRGVVVASGGDDRLVHLWDARSHENMAVIECAGKVFCLALCGNLLATGGSDDCAAYLWDLRQLTRPVTALGPGGNEYGGRVTCVALEPTMLLAGDEAGLLRRWKQEAWGGASS